MLTLWLILSVANHMSGNHTSAVEQQPITILTSAAPEHEFCICTEVLQAFKGLLKIMCCNLTFWFLKIYILNCLWSKTRKLPNVSALQTNEIRIYMFTFMYLAADFIQRDLQKGNKGKDVSKNKQCHVFLAVIKK